MAGVAAAEGVPGRFEPVDAGQPFAVIVDYAHTPTGIDAVLRTARPLGTRPRALRRRRRRRPRPRQAPADGGGGRGGVRPGLRDERQPALGGPGGDPRRDRRRARASRARRRGARPARGHRPRPGRGAAGRRRRHLRQGTRAGPGGQRARPPLRRPHRGPRAAAARRRDRAPGPGGRGGALAAGDGARRVEAVVVDSRAVGTGRCSSRCPGERVDGHDYLAEAADAGRRRGPVPPRVAHPRWAPWPCSRPRTRSWRWRTSPGRCAGGRGRRWSASPARPARPRPRTPCAPCSRRMPEPWPPSRTTTTSSACR